MRFSTRVFTVLAAAIIFQVALSQTNRIKYNNQELFLSGANLAWVSFALDIGSGNPDTVAFADMFLAVHNHGGNAVRWWLHTDGRLTPVFDTSTNHVTGPGAHTISDMKKVLDIAWQREIGLKLCLWSFDMLNTSNSAAVLYRNKLLLNDTNYTRAYINNCLIPIVDSLKGNPAILGWEIFNEPEGMSNEFGWSTTQHVPMATIQRFVNLCAGAIHRADPNALVTNGCWSFKALTDVPTAVAPPSAGLGEFSKVGLAEKESIARQFNKKYRTNLTVGEVMNYLDRMSILNNKNYYSDSQLIGAGGDPDGVLDFYSVHYYSGIDPSSPTAISPFHHPASYWGLNKSIVVAEFAMASGQGNPPGIPTASMYDTLYQLGYAGALPWAWTDPTFSSISDMLAGIQSMWDNHRSDVDVLGIGVDWPTVTITSPLNNSVFPDTSQLTITVTVSDTLAIDSVEFFLADTIKIGGVSVPTHTSGDTSNFAFTWKNIQAGIYSITAAATNSKGHQQISSSVQITVGTPPMIRLEAETATRTGPGMTVGTDPSASGGKYVDVAAGNDTTSKITWTLNSVPKDGNYPIMFGVKLKYQSPKTQFVNVNGAPADTVVFSGSTSAWTEIPATVNLVQGVNTIQMAMSWGWMYVDYLAVPTGFVTTLVNNSSTMPAVYSLSQNYPNPFNPTTTIEFSLAKASNVKLTVYNVLGQKVATLVDGYMKSGSQSVVFDARLVSSGVYYYRLEAGSFTRTAKMMLVK
jgi:Carbohydrate binding module (family 35)/Bacterial Ig domain/Secretion system C-terminal sorting domain/Cellulase (glycosyl hydrolase family 5)